MKREFPTPRTYNSMDKLTFGKHKGLTIDRVVQFDPEYITWMRSVGICDTETVLRRDRGELRNDDIRGGYAKVWTWD
jgi:hypothetical protein